MEESVRTCQEVIDVNVQKVFYHLRMDPHVLVLQFNINFS